jgi:hypothetical protein
MSRFTDEDLLRFSDVLRRGAVADAEEIGRLFETDGEICDALPEIHFIGLPFKPSKGIMRNLVARFFRTGKRPNA